MDDKKSDEATEEVNPSPNEEEESSSEKETLEDSEEKVETKPEEIAGDYLEDKPKDTRTQEDYKKRWEGSTKEYEKLKKEADSYSQAMKQLEKLAEMNPNILSEIEKAQQQSSGGSSPDDVDERINKAIEPVIKVTQELENKEKLKQVKVLTSFEKKNPDLFPPKATAEEKKAIRQRIGKVANTLVDTGMSFKEAVDRAYLVVNPKAAEKKGRDKAYVEGLSEERAGFSSQTSTEGKRDKKVKYNQRELEIAEKMGVKQAMIGDQ